MFAFDSRISESGVLEYALTAFLTSASDEQLAKVLRSAGYGLRRKTDFPASEDESDRSQIAS